MKKSLLLKIAAMTLMAIAFVSCKQEIQPTGVKLNPTTLALETGATANLTATVEPAGAIGSVSWSSSNDAVASVKEGVVTAKSAGSATITAKISTFSATCTVTVTDPFVKVESVTLDKTTLALVEGDNATLTATVKPDNATDKAVTWTSDNTAVATVKDGVVTAVAEGSAKITAKAGDASAVCEVAVAKKVIAVESVALDKTSLELTEGDTATLTATVKPDDATDKTVTWTSDNTAVATVADGVVTAVAEGTAKITAKAGDATAVCEVSVAKKVIAVESVSLDKTSLELTKGETATLTATVKPDDATDKTVTWTSDNTAVATVVEGVVTAVAEGTAKITAKAGDATAVCTVTVKADAVKVTEIKINEEDFSLKVGETKALTVTVKPDDATDKTVTWSSDNTAVATVADGVVTAVAEGTAKITVKANGGDDVTASVNVTVTAGSSGAYAANLGVYKLTATGKHKEYDTKTKKWKVVNGSVAFDVVMVENEPDASYAALIYVDDELDSYFIIDWDSATGAMTVSTAELEEWENDTYGTVEYWQEGYIEYQKSLYSVTGEYPICFASAPSDGKIVFESSGSLNIQDLGEFAIVGLNLSAHLPDYEGGNYVITYEQIPFPITLTKTDAAAAPKATKKLSIKRQKVELPATSLIIR